ncbi:hypothetical protein ACWEVD_17695 [Nocardia thailandica]|uniref:Bacterial Ig-like domain-containing protein n=1 Tax=Nocardia thailandica TaxID=257275 RepID=A0ABW6PGQ2_9NOCA|nr:hypothetical protein [Nocardia thailandica]
MQYRRNITRAVAALSIAATGAWCAGAAGADAQRVVSISSPTPRVGCTYTVESTVLGGSLESVLFMDGTETIPASPLALTQSAAGNTRAVSWTPTTAGTHTITAHYAYLSASIMPSTLTVVVAPAEGTGSAGCGIGSWLSSLSAG